VHAGAGVVFGDTFEVRLTGDAMGEADTTIFAQLNFDTLTS
jgi:hypothetical protein